MPTSKIAILLFYSVVSGMLGKWEGDDGLTSITHIVHYILLLEYGPKPSNPLVPMHMPHHFNVVPPPFRGNGSGKEVDVITTTTTTLFVV